MWNDEKYGRLEREFVEFVLPLRQGKALDFDAYKSVVSLVRSIRGDFLEMESIPRKTVLLLLDMYPSMIGAAGGRSDEERVQVERWANDLYDDIQALVA